MSSKNELHLQADAWSQAYGADGKFLVDVKALTVAGASKQTAPRGNAAMFGKSVAPVAQQHSAEEALERSTAPTANPFRNGSH